MRGEPREDASRSHECLYVELDWIGDQYAVTLLGPSSTLKDPLLCDVNHFAPLQEPYRAIFARIDAGLYRKML